ncbi:OLC1v1010751C1 [Oldenlandia corymbosa var. corymbosa]|uniref:OLC1v1010751C1 n=1 Tax=Oldenlandia corymbosa var. corymbosa TaxID=529605 RepID=A0AAV1DV29_OLDCO|nr:OLC1v1010751C1 [Oldenlandia corymbosa var. corymbosa]
MRMSCNGCRVLRKGCSENCSIKPCLQWIKSPESQANATVFLAKFYGRAGLMNLVNAGPDHLRPAIFRSLLYEACGRIVNPIYGSVGLLWSGNWQLCQNAVEAVLKGAPITQIATEAAETNNGPPLKAYDIRHVSKNDNKLDGSGTDLHRVRSRCRFKRSSAKSKAGKVDVRPLVEDDLSHDEENRSTSHESSLSHQSEAAAAAAGNVEGESRNSESLASEETAEAEILETVDDGSALGSTTTADKQSEFGEIELELTLGFESCSRASASKPKQTWRNDAADVDASCRMELGLHYSA